MSFQNNLKSYERMASMTNMLGVSLIDMLKPNIKTKQNENVIKMLDIVKDKPEAYLDLLSVAIFHKNLEIIKLIIEKYIHSEIDVPYMNAFSFYNSILSDESKYKLTDSKDSYIEIICPFALMAGIGGNIEIFNYLLNNHLIPDLNVSGTIGLSKRYKNAFTSNIVGACAYYGNDKLLEHLLINYRSQLDINIISTEKKSKNTKIHFIKELTRATPPFLACAGVASDEKTIEILKILEEYKANFKLKNYNNDNIFHIITQTKKIETLKFLVNSLELKDIMNDVNNDNITPFWFAQQKKNQEMISFFNSLEKDNENRIKENVKELIEDSDRRANQKKRKGKKRKKDEIPSLLNSSEYQETFKVQEENIEENINNKDSNEPNIDQEENDKNNQIKEEDNFEDENEEDSNIKNENRYYKNKNKDKYSNFKKYKSDYISNYNVSFSDVYNKSNKYKNNYDKYINYNTSYNKNYNNNYNKNNYNTNFNNNYKFNYVNTDYNYKNNYNIDNLYRKKSSGIYKNPNQKVYYNNNYSGFSKIQNNYNKKRYDNYNIQTYKNSYKDKLQNNSNQSNKIENETFNNKNSINSNDIDKQENEENSNAEEKNGNDNNKIEEEKKEEKKEEKNEEENSEDESSYSENFLSESDDYNNIVSFSEYNKLLKKYFDMERKCNNLEQEKVEINSFIKNIILENKMNLKNIPNNEENINSLLNLANEELQSKNKIINELKRDTKMTDLSDIKNFTKEQLQEYKDFYIKNLKLIDDTLKNHNI